MKNSVMIDSQSAGREIQTVLSQIRFVLSFLGSSGYSINCK
ncbi:hypothetical protein PR003_g31779 [Phytophthora rubi]|uniref:Uncharacterized protein n=1 Tax=Phytophthora rubi TaxID=129364 RepID=A0A6A3GVG3_9STRA|nr:hypothetical protein PR002_g30032 [Phytophthora rubi]KAE9267422.1 hypothetical protein PR003_g31779 [Phytophthora rubi]